MTNYDSLLVENGFEKTGISPFRIRFKREKRPYRSRVIAIQQSMYNSGSK